MKPGPCSRILAQAGSELGRAVLGVLGVQSFMVSLLRASSLTIGGGCSSCCWVTCRNASNIPNFNPHVRHPRGTCRVIVPDHTSQIFQEMGVNCRHIWNAFRTVFVLQGSSREYVFYCSETLYIGVECATYPGLGWLIRSRKNGGRRL
jgi:hypothetical protein